MFQTIFSRAAMAAVIALLLTVSAFAQDSGRADDAAAQPARPSEGWTGELGVASIVNPSFQGANSYEVIPVPYFDVRYSNTQGVKYFGNIPQGFGGYITRNRDARGSQNDFFISIAPGFANREVDDVEGIEEFGPAAELRVGWEFAKGSWAMGATVAQAVGTGHEGAYLDLNAAWRKRLGQRGFLSVGPTLRIADGQYMDAFYGITPTETAASGIATYDASAGIESVGVQGIVSVPVSERWRLTTVVSVSQLQADAADSSLTEEPTQAFFLTALTYRF
ncbi:MAG: MipA/OmpV family protein [Pseudomonadota bacterium]